MFSRSSSEDVKSRAKAGAAVAQSRAYQAKAAAVRAQELARQTATTQVAPLARSAQEKAAQGLLEARAWTAPRVEAGGVAVQERLAPAVTAAMVTAARRIEPAEGQASSLAAHRGRGRGAGRGLRRRGPGAPEQAERRVHGGIGSGNVAAHAAGHSGRAPGDDRRRARGRKRAGQDALT